MCCSARQAEREIEVRKLRGTDALRGRHSFRITDRGIVVYPRIEALLARPSGDDQWPDERCATGVDQLDKMIGGGIPRGTTTLVLGASGSGKTSLGLHFLSQSSAEEPGLFFGFYETPLRLRVKAAGIGIALDGLIEQGHLEILWHPPTEDILDALGNRLVEAVRRRRVKRLVIDGLLGFQEIAADRPHRIGRFLTALANELRVLNVTTFYTAETRNLIGGVIEGPTIGLSTIAENLILLRYVEIRSQLRRLISVVKMRDSDFDSSLREFRITAAGIELAQTFDSAEAILSGFPQLTTEELPADKAARRPRGTVIMATVLVVDDEFGIVDVLETILTDEGYRVLTACNGKQGLVRLSEEKPDVVLLDFMMPILGGAEMLPAMAAEPAYRRIPVIMMSSLAEDVLAERCTGYAAYLHKPFRATAVLSTIARVLGARANAGIL